MNEGIEVAGLCNMEELFLAHRLAREESSPVASELYGGLARLSASIGCLRARASSSQRRFAGSRCRRALASALAGLSLDLVHFPNSQDSVRQATLGEQLPLQSMPRATS